MSGKITPVKPGDILDSGGNSEVNPRTVILELPGRQPRVFTELVLDFTGTLSLDGSLLPGVSERLQQLAEHLRITVLTADTFGTAIAQLEGLPVEVRLVQNGKDKADVLRMMSSEKAIAIGNGLNDMPMLEVAGLGIAVIGPEGAVGALLRAAEVVVCDIRDALNLLLHPLRLKATLRD